MIENASKICPFCKASFIRLPEHIIKRHPHVIEQLNEMGNKEAETVIPKSNNNIQPTNAIASKRENLDTASLIREKLNVMLDIKIIEMLSHSSDMSLKQLKETLDPPKTAGISEMKEYFTMFKELQPEPEEYENELPYVETENEWVNVVQQLIPLAKTYLEGKGGKTITPYSMINTNSNATSSNASINGSDSMNIPNSIEELKKHPDYPKLKIAIKNNLIGEQQLWDKMQQYPDKIPKELTREAFSKYFAEIKAEP